MTIQDNANSLKTNTLVTTSETLILASNFFAITPELAPTTVLIAWVWVAWTPGTACTGLTCRMRRDFGTGGANDGQITGAGPITVGALQTSVFAFPINTAWLAQPGGGQYSVTLQQVGATANASITAAMATFWYREAPAGGVQPM